MTKKTQTKLQGLLVDQNFCNHLYNCMEVEVASAYFKEHDLELTEDEVLKILNDIKYDKANLGDLSDNALDAVVGGDSKKCIKWNTLGLCLKWE
ncbi:MAG: hypothetical protein RSF88_07455 [Lachnospiraceae bacterium]